MKPEPWHATFIQSLQELADLQAQTRAWVGGAAPEFPSPTELVCQVFDDSGILELLARGPVFSPETDACLLEVSRRVDEVDLEQPPQDLVRNAAWLCVVHAAADALRAASAVLHER
jgi:hypothetical protein